YVLNATFQPLHGDGEGAVAVTVPTGADAGRIGELLAERGVVDSGAFFQLNATITGRRGKLRPGDYTLRRGMSHGGAVAALVEGPRAKAVKTIDVNVPEGLSIGEAAPRVDQGPLEGSYLKAARSARTLRKLRGLGAPRRTRTAEGFLFPATYTLVDGAPARNLVDRQLAAFQENIEKVDMRTARRRNLTRYDVLVIASMVERETQLDRERPLVAAVIHNRLKEGTPLGIDATIRYVEENWSSPLKESELERDTPYNTRLNRGLPPTPIGNPGLAALKAAAAPADAGYLYYVVKPCGRGAHTFTKSYDAFLAATRRYEAEREKQGGRSPVEC
ncbi:MAG: endolytic transglycosylase MltG, partial [Solirubrobacteraceae bacterium]